MNQKSFVIAAILAAVCTLCHCNTFGICSNGLPEEDPATGDISTTSTDQNVKQKNTGSGESTNSNCGENLIKAGVEDQECEFED